MRAIRWSVSMVMLGTLAGCVLPPPVPPPAPPLVALPGSGKTQAQFQADDAECRTAANNVPINGQAVPASPPAASTPAQAGAAPPAAPQVVIVTPGMVYLRCMTSHSNTVQALAPVHPAFYGYYAPYPIYAGFGDYYPWLYGDGIGFGFYGGYGGWRGGYGGWRGGDFRGGDFRGGEFRGVGGGRR